MCDTREAWYRNISFRSSVYVILGKPGVGTLVKIYSVCVILEKPGVGKLVLDLVCM